MRGRTVSPVLNSVGENNSSYVQINIYNTNVKQLQERGVDIKNIIEHIGCRSIIMDVPILKAEELDHEKKGCPLVTTGRASPFRSSPATNRVESVSDGNTMGDEACAADWRNKSKMKGRRKEELNKPLNLVKKTAASACISNSESAEGIFHDCIQEYERDDGLGKVSHCATLLTGSGTPSDDNFAPSSTQPAGSGTEDVDEAHFPRDISSNMEENTENIHEGGMENTAQIEPERSFMEFSRRVVDGIHALKLISKSALHSAVTSKASGEAGVNKRKPATVQNKDVDQSEKHIEELDTSYLLTDLTQDEPNTPGEKALQNIGRNMGERQAQRKRRRSYSQPLQPPDDGKNAVQSVGQNCVRSEDPQERVFHCKYPGCSVKVSWRPRYGKNRLVNHARVHWGKKMKKCCCCDYVAVHQTKILRHHRNSHPDNEFMGAQSLETDEDMEDLLQLWKQCFPDLMIEEFHDSRWERSHCRRTISLL